jgi:uncharacterized lipoprotein
MEDACIFRLTAFALKLLIITILAGCGAGDTDRTQVSQKQPKDDTSLTSPSLASEKEIQPTASKSGPAPSNKTPASFELTDPPTELKEDQPLPRSEK